MMSALATVDELMTNAKIMEDYGAQAVVIMDSTGTYLPDDVKSRIFRLKDGLNVPIGFHAHNNLNYAIFFNNNLKDLKFCQIIVEKYQPYLALINYYIDNSLDNYLDGLLLRNYLL